MVLNFARPTQMNADADVGTATDDALIADDGPLANLSVIPHSSTGGNHCTICNVAAM
jgi:hypothetical protein